MKVKLYEEERELGFSSFSYYKILTDSVDFEKLYFAKTTWTEYLLKAYHSTHVKLQLNFSETINSILDKIIEHSNPKVTFNISKSLNPYKLRVNFNDVLLVIKNKTKWDQLGLNSDEYNFLTLCNKALSTASEQKLVQYLTGLSDDYSTAKLTDLKRNRKISRKYESEIINTLKDVKVFNACVLVNYDDILTYQEWNDKNSDYKKFITLKQLSKLFDKLDTNSLIDILEHASFPLKDCKLITVDKHTSKNKVMLGFDRKVVAKELSAYFSQKLALL